MRVTFPTLILVVALLVTAAPVWAAGSEGHGESSAKPTLLDVDLAATVVAVATFLVLLFVLTKLAWKPVLNGLKAREETIRKAVDDAAKASAEARALVAQYDQKLAAAAEDARGVHEAARREAEAYRKRIEEDAHRTAEETLARSVREIGEAKRAALDAILKDVTAIATEAASRIVRRHLDPAGNADLVDEVVEGYARARRGGGA